MLKIEIVTYGNPTDLNTWSRTPAMLKYGLNKISQVKVGEGIDLSEICRTENFVKRVIRKVISTFIFVKGSLRDPLIFGYSSGQIANNLVKYNTDAYLFCAEHALSIKTKPINSKSYIYIDSLLRPHIEYEITKKRCSGLFLKFYEQNEKISFEKAKGIFTMNDWSKSYLIEKYGINAKKIHNVGFGINTDFYDGAKDYNNNLLLIVLREGTEYQKGLWMLLDAYEILRKEIANVRLAVVGTCEKRHMDGVEYYYNQPREKTLELFKLSSLFVMPNIQEVNGITYLEALANRTPIVGLDRYAFPEFSGYGAWGFIVKESTAESLAQVLHDALSDSDRLKKMGVKGQEFVKTRYSWELVSEKMVSVIKNDI